MSIEGLMPGYLSEISDNNLGSTPSESIGAQAFFRPNQDNTNTTPVRLTHKAGTPVRQSIVAAVGTKSFLRSKPHSPLTAVYFLSISARAQDESTSTQNPISIEGKRGDRSEGYDTLSRRFFDSFFPPAFPPYHDYRFSWSSSADPHRSNLTQSFGTHESAAVTLPCGVPESRPGRLPSLNG